MFWGRCELAAADVDVDATDKTCIMAVHRYMCEGMLVYPYLYISGALEHRSNGIIDAAAFVLST